MRREPGTNLLEAAGEPGGVPAAVRRLGSLREPAREAVVDAGGTRWGRGAMSAVITVAVVLLAQLVLSSVHVDALFAAGGGQGILLGNEVTASEDGGGIGASADLDGWPLLAVPPVFVLQARPWRLACPAPGA